MVKQFRIAVSLLVLLVASTSTMPAGADEFGTGANLFEIEFVPIGDPGNVGDADGGPPLSGAVSYEYSIGKYAIPEQVVAKFNAEVGFALGVSVFPTRGPNKPATGISWFEACRFINWLNTSTGHLPAYKFNGFTFALWQETDPGYDPDNQYRNTLALYVLPSLDEWYKAAYYDPVTATYFNFPTGSDSVPTSVATGIMQGTAVWNRSFSEGPADVQLAGGLSPYGTMGQGGNVYEWEETASFFVNDNVGHNRGYRGGVWDDFSSNWMLSTTRLDGHPANEIGSVGFRVAKRVLTAPLPTFVRGDCNVDDTFDIADPISLLGFLFPTGAAVPLDCDLACDANDDGTVDIGDAIAALGGLFGTPAVPLSAPHPDCGTDPTPDTLDCNLAPFCP